MACGPAAQCRASHIASALSDVKPDGGDFEARCPVCGHGGFRISQPTRSHYRHIWTCACRRCKCRPEHIRAALLNLGIRPGCIGSYGTHPKAGTDPVAAQRIEQAVRDILAVPGLKPSDMRIVLAEALGSKVPEDRREFVAWAMGIGIGRRQAYEAAERWCRPAA